MCSVGIIKQKTDKMQDDIPGGQEEKSEIPEIIFKEETYLSVAKRKIQYFLTNITLEPVMLFYGVIRSIDRVSQDQLIIDKTCLNDFPFGEDVCNNLLADENSVANTDVQNEVAQFKVYESIVDHVFPVICSFFLGSWSDTFGRKWLLYAYFFFCMVHTSGLMLNSAFMSWPKEYLLFSVNLPVALSGGHITFSMGIASFITDISTPEQRTFRLASVYFVESLGGPLGTKIGAYLWEVGGYLCVFGTSLLGKGLTLLILLIRLEMFKWRPGSVGEEKERPVKRRNALSPGHIKVGLGDTLSRLIHCLSGLHGRHLQEEGQWEEILFDNVHGNNVDLLPAVLRRGFSRIQLREDEIPLGPCRVQ